MPMEAADPQLYRGVSRGREAAGRLTLGHHRAPPAASQAEVPLPGTQANRRSTLPDRNSVCAPHGRPVGVPPARDGLRQRRDLLAKAARLAEGRCLGEAPPRPARTAEPGRRDRLGARRSRLLPRPIGRSWGKKAAQVPWIAAVPEASITCSRTVTAFRWSFTSPRPTIPTSTSSTRRWTTSLPCAVREEHLAFVRVECTPIADTTRSRTASVSGSGRATLLGAAQHRTRKQSWDLPMGG